jgi:hypothetical protein
MISITINIMISITMSIMISITIGILIRDVYIGCDLDR